MGTNSEVEETIVQANQSLENRETQENTSQQQSPVTQSGIEQTTVSPEDSGEECTIVSESRAPASSSIRYGKTLLKCFF